MQHEHVDFPEALKMLAARYHITLPDRQLSDAERARLKERDLSSVASSASDYSSTSGGSTGGGFVGGGGGEGGGGGW